MAVVSFGISYNLEKVFGDANQVLNANQITGRKRKKEKRKTDSFLLFSILSHKNKLILKSCLQHLYFSLVADRREGMKETLENGDS